MLLFGLRDRLKLRVAICYLEGVKRAHRIVLLAGAIVFVITLAGAGILLVPLALLLFAPWEPATKAMVGISIGAVLVLVPAVALTMLLSEKRWMRLTGATALLRNLAE